MPRIELIERRRDMVVALWKETLPLTSSRILRLSLTTRLGRVALAILSFPSPRFCMAACLFSTITSEGEANESKPIKPSQQPKPIGHNHTHNSWNGVILILIQLYSLSPIANLGNTQRSTSRHHAGRTNLSRM